MKQSPKQALSDGDKLIAGVLAPIAGAVGVLISALLQEEVVVANLLGLISAPVSVVVVAVATGRHDHLLRKVVLAAVVAVGLAAFIIALLVLAAMTLIDAG